MAVLRVLVDTPPCFQNFVHLLYIRRGDFRNLLVSEVWLDVEVRIPAVSVQCAGPDCAGHDRIEPVVQPFAQGELAVLGQVYALVGGNLLAELCGLGWDTGR